MPERFLEIVRQADGIDTTVTSIPIGDKDTVRLHGEGSELVRAVIRHPRTHYDKIERDGAVRPETVLVDSSGNVVNAIPTEAEQPVETTAKAAAAPRTRTPRSAAKKSTAKKK